MEDKILIYSHRSHTGNKEEAVHAVDEILNNICFGTFQIVLFFLCSFTYFAVACDILTLAFVGIEVSELWDLDGITFAILPSVTCFTNLVGSIVFSSRADRHGRRWPYAASVTYIGLYVLASAFLPCS